MTTQAHKFILLTISNDDTLFPALVSVKLKNTKIVIFNIIGLTDKSCGGF